MTKEKKKYFRIFMIILLIIFLVIVFLIINKNREDKTDEHRLNEDLNELFKGEDNMDEFTSKINIKINDTNYIATLEDNATSREFLKRLPIEINMNELNGNEKYYYFDESFPSNSSKIGKINRGDLMLYGSDCLVLFYETFDTKYSYTRIGKIDNPESLVNNVGKGNIKITFTK